MIFRADPREKKDIDGTQLFGTLEIANTIYQARKMRILNYYVLIKFILRRITGGIFHIYAIRSEDGYIHTTQVTSKDWRFSFMGEQDLFIGPSWTSPAARGKGIFPAVLRRVMNDYNDRIIWATVSPDNKASIRGIEKAGFHFCGRLKERRYLRMIPRRYLEVNNESGKWHL